MKISFAILAYNEHAELDQLLGFLTGGKRSEDEIVLVLDEGSTTRQVEQV